MDHGDVEMSRHLAISEGDKTENGAGASGANPVPISGFGSSGVLLSH